MSDFSSSEQEFWLYARALKREGAEYDGQTVSVKERDVIRCCKCRNNATPLYAKKYGIILNDLNKSMNLEYFCENCKKNIGRCFICRKVFESDKDLSVVNHTQIECKKCLTSK